MEYSPRKKRKEKDLLHQHIQQSERKFHQILKLLKRRDKQCQEQSKTIRKNQAKLSELKKRVEVFEKRERLK
jgi:hypothetical protein